MQHDKKKSRLFRNKRGINDISIIAVILFIFIGTGITLVFVNDEFDITGSEFDTEGIADDLISSEVEDVSSIGVSATLASVGKVFFWTFGDLPFWLDAVFLVLRIILLVILIRNFTPFLGGGG